MLYGDQEHYNYLFLEKNKMVNSISVTIHCAGDIQRDVKTMMMRRTSEPDQLHGRTMSIAKDILHILTSMTIKIIFTTKVCILLFGCMLNILVGVSAYVHTLGRTGRTPLA